MKNHNIRFLIFVNQHQLDKAVADRQKMTATLPLRRMISPVAVVKRSR